MEECEIDEEEVPMEEVIKAAGAMLDLYPGYNLANHCDDNSDYDSELDSSFDDIEHDALSHDNEFGDFIH